MTDKKYHHGDLKNALIQAGIEILSKEGVNGLSLRKVAQRAGVSHAAPYAHFADKQALIAAISTEGYKAIYARIAHAVEQYPDDPLQQLIEGAWAYVSFAMSEPDHFRITLSGVVEKNGYGLNTTGVDAEHNARIESEYPAFRAAARHSTDLVEGIVGRCQQAGILNPGPTNVLAVTVWALIHGIVSLVLDAQVSHEILDRYSLRHLLIFSLAQLAAPGAAFDRIIERESVPF